MLRRISRAPRACFVLFPRIAWGEGAEGPWFSGRAGRGLDLLYILCVKARGKYAPSLLISSQAKDNPQY